MLCEKEIHIFHSFCFIWVTNKKSSLAVTVYPDKLKENIYDAWITPVAWEQQGKQEINQMPSQMPAQPAIAISYTPLTDKGETC